jgi:hypothetical protein
MTITIISSYFLDSCKLTQPTTPRSTISPGTHTWPASFWLARQSGWSRSGITMRR